MGSPHRGGNGRGPQDTHRDWLTKACRSGHSTADVGTAEHSATIKGAEDGLRVERHSYALRAEATP
jgi:hypothetical protein